MSRRDERDIHSAPSSASGTHGASLLSPLLWPLAATLAFQSAALSIMTPRAADRREPPPAPDWPTPHRITLELQTMRLRDFSRRPEGPPALICAPLALHGASVADFASGHSLVETLLDAGLARVLVTDWRSATPDLRHLTIDNHLAELNVAVDDCGAPVDLIGLCQGGWLALLYAARFPHKVRRLVIAGAPVDIRAGASALSRLVDDLPLAAFEETVRAGGGRLIGARAREAWPTLTPSRIATDVLQAPAALDEGALRGLLDRFATWDAATIDLPGPYYLQVVQWLFKENRIARGTFVTLGRAVNLRDVRCPAYLLAARDDQIVAPEQLLAAARLLGTPAHAIETTVEPGEHLSLFLGAGTLRGRWRRIARWLRDDQLEPGSKAA